MKAALICLALNIYFEARGEPTVFAMAAPAHVVLNRVKDNRYPNDILRRHLSLIKTGVCWACGINLYGKGKERVPAASALPCPVKDCPY